MSCTVVRGNGTVIVRSVSEPFTLASPTTRGERTRATRNTKEEGTGPRSREDALSPNLGDCTRSKDKTTPPARRGGRKRRLTNRTAPNLFGVCGKTKRDEPWKPNVQEYTNKKTQDVCVLNESCTLDSNLSAFVWMTFGDHNDELCFAVLQRRICHTSINECRKNPWASVVFKLFARHFC